VWNKDHIANVRISFEEKIGAEGRGGYFDEFGIIRDVMQNHMVQMLALLAMEPPASLGAEHIRDAKTALLKQTRPISKDEIVVGQYVAGNGHEGYLEDPTVKNKESITPTFAVAIVHIDNPRWNGVPFIMKSGKGLDNTRTEIRIQFKQPEEGLFPNLLPNEMVLRVSPEEAVYVKILIKKPGLTEEVVVTELDLTYKSRFEDQGHPPRIPGAYERLLLDVLHGDHRLFVRADELAAAWDVFTPVLKYLEECKVKPIPYEFGSRGPREADEFIAKYGFRLTPGYQWPKQRL